MIYLMGVRMASEREAVTNLTKFYTLVLLNDGPKHGYEIMVELKKKIGKRPSAGQIYPLLKKLEKSGLVAYEIVKIGEKEKKVYRLTATGKKTYSRIVARFSDLISIILEPRLTRCWHCGCKIYEGGYTEKIEGQKLMFCCIHCAEAYKRTLKREKPKPFQKFQ
jgi:PadR family transcriptional regulator PadR